MDVCLMNGRVAFEVFKRNFCATRFILILGDIQIIRDTFGGGGVRESVTEWHKGGVGLAKVSRDIFSKILS